MNVKLEATTAKVDGAIAARLAAIEAMAAAGSEERQSEKNRKKRKAPVMTAEDARAMVGTCNPCPGRHTGAGGQLLLARNCAQCTPCPCSNGTAKPRLRPNCAQCTPCPCSKGTAKPVLATKCQMCQLGSITYEEAQAALLEAGGDHIRLSRTQLFVLWRRICEKPESAFSGSCTKEKMIKAIKKRA